MYYTRLSLQQRSREKTAGFINDSIAQISLEAPFLFEEWFFRLATEPDVVPGDTSDVLKIPISESALAGLVNPYVLVRTGAPLGSFPVGYPNFQTDRSWDGRWIELALDDDTVFSTQIRSVWIEEDYEGSGNDYYAISLLTPIPLGEDGVGPAGTATWRIYTPVYYFPDDLVEFKALRIVSSDSPSKIEFISQDEAETSRMLDVPASTAGTTPRWAFRRGHYQLPGLNTAPEVELATGTNWKGPEPPGVFQYAATVAWGKRDIHFQSHGPPVTSFKGDNPVEGASGNDPDSHEYRMREPRFESAPTPVSDTVTVPAPGPSALALNSMVKVLLPSVSYEQGFQMVGNISAAAFQRLTTDHGGMTVRIWRRRISADFTNYATFSTAATATGITGLKKLDIQDDYYLLAEIRSSATGETTFYDDGSYIPDKNRRLRDVHGYQGVGLYPPPDARYVLEARGLRRPPQLISDSDVPNIHPEACKLIVDYACSLLYEMLKDPQMKESSRQEYRAGLQALVKRYSDLRPVSQPARVRPARSAIYRRAANPWWR